MSHDPLCYVAKNGGNCCPWMPSCDCQCMCDWIAEIREDERGKFVQVDPTYMPAEQYDAMMKALEGEA